MSIWETYMDTEYPDFYEQHQNTWCLFKKSASSSFTLAKIDWVQKDSVRVTEYGFGEYSHCIKLEDIFTRSTDISILRKMLRIFTEMEKFEQERFNCYKVLLSK